MAINTIIALALLSQTSVAPMCKVSLTLMPTSPLTEETYLGAIREQIQLGVQGTYPSVKWSDFSPTNTKALDDQIGLSKFIGGDAVLCIKPIDTSNKTVPDSLSTFSFDDPKLVEKWEEMILSVAKTLPKSVKAIALGNEVDVYFSEHPNELPAYLNLMRNTKTLLRGAGVKVPIGVVTTFDGAIRRPELVKQIQSSFDITMMTYYPVDSAYKVLPTGDVAKHFQAMLDIAGTKPLVLTEIGCPAGEANGSNEEVQASFVTESFKQLRQHDKRILQANYFMQADFSEQMVDMFEMYYRLKDDRFRSYLSTLGLTKGDGTKRKAFFEFKKQMRLWNVE